MSNFILRTQGVVKRFGGLIAVNNVSIDVSRGSITLLIGPNGCGKTTLVNVITGIYKPESGRIYFKDKDITGLSPDEIFRRGLVRTFQIPMPFQKLSVLDNLLVSARRNIGESFIGHFIRSKWISEEDRLVEKAFRILKMIGLDKYWDREASTLDAGGLKLLEIGRALMSDAEMIVLDEPIAGVNPKMAHNVFSHIVDLRNKLGVTFLIIEHRLDIALRYVNYVYVMNRGEIISQGNPEAIISDEKVRAVYMGGV
ncbi:MAG: ABC transporter ATP-binding protein [Sulfolobales archaeon]